jgi:hypothetical protein
MHKEWAMTKSAAISVRVDERLKEELEKVAKQEGRSLASLVERRLSMQLQPPKWTLRDVQPLNWKSKGPLVALPVAEGWPTAVLQAEHAEALGKQLLAAAQLARKLPPA